VPPRACSVGSSEEKGNGHTNYLSRPAAHRLPGEGHATACMRRSIFAIAKPRRCIRRRPPQPHSRDFPIDPRDVDPGRNLPLLANFFSKCELPHTPPLSHKATSNSPSRADRHPLCCKYHAAIYESAK
jgi:hypothetical protein